MIVVETSAWVEYLRGTGFAVDVYLDRLISDAADLGVTKVVVGEVLAGARSGQHRAELLGRVGAFPVLSLGGLAGFEAAGDL